MSGGIYTTDKSKSLISLNDVDVNNLANGQALIYDSTTETFTNQDIDNELANISTVANELIKKNDTGDGFERAHIIATASSVGALTKQKTTFVNSQPPVALPLSSIESVFNNGFYNMFLNPHEGNPLQKRMSIHAFLNDIFVGINTDTPLEGLHLLGSFRIDNNTTQQIRFFNIQGTTKESATIKVDDNGGGADIKFLTRPSGGVEPVQGMILDKGGNVGIGTNTPTKKLDVNGSIKADNLYLGETGQEPRIDMLYEDSAGGSIYDIKIEIGKSDNFTNSPAEPPANAFGMNVQANADALFVGIENFSAGNFRPLLKWGFEATDTPFKIQSRATDKSFDFGTDGSFKFPGTLSVGTTPSTGTAGQVLTSQGSVNPPQWVSPITPVYVAVLKNGDKAISVPATTTTFATVDGMTIDYQSAPIGTTAYNVLTGEFTAPRAGIYIIDYAVNVIDDAPHYTEFIGAIVSINRGSGFVREMRQNYADVQRQTLLYTLRAHYMTQLNAGDIVKNEIEIYNNSVSVATIRGNATTARATYQTIHSIT